MMSTVCMQKNLSYDNVSHNAPNWKLGFYRINIKTETKEEDFGTTLVQSGLDNSLSKKADRMWHEAISYAPKTNRGRRLWAICAEIIASGTPLLGPQELEKEIAERRGELR